VPEALVSEVEAMAEEAPDASPLRHDADDTVLQVR
jgi:hypothetical protein